jgi:hypothetical protein
MITLDTKFNINDEFYIVFLYKKNFDFIEIKNFYISAINISGMGIEYIFRVDRPYTPYQDPIMSHYEDFEKIIEKKEDVMQAEGRFTFRELIGEKDPYKTEMYILKSWPEVKSLIDKRLSDHT